MLNILHIFMGLSSNARYTFPRSRLVFLVLVLVLSLSLSGAGQITPARAAPPAQEPTYTNMRWYLNISNPGTLCAGRDYPIRVTPLVDLDGTFAGEKFKYIGKIMTGVSLTAEVTDKSIATVEPAKPKSKKSGYLPGNLLETASFRNQEKLDGLGEVIFKFHALKAGTTNFYLTAKVPKQWSGSTEKYFGPGGMPTGGPIKVFNCKYKVQIYYSMLGFWALNTSGSIMGYMETFLTSDDGEYFRGAGVLDTAESRTVPGCSHSDYGFKSPTTITGKLTGEQLDLSIAYQPGQYSVTSSCAGITTTSSGTEDPSVWMQTSASFPETGGSQSKRLDFSEWLGTSTITVTPVSGSAP